MALSTTLLVLVAALCLHPSATGGSSISVNPMATPTPTQSSLPNGLGLLDIQRQAVIFTLIDTTLAEWSSSVEGSFLYDIVPLADLYCAVQPIACNLTVSANFTDNDIFFLPSYPTVLEVTNIQIALVLLLPNDNAYPLLPQSELISLLLSATPLLQGAIGKIITGISAFPIPVEPTTTLIVHTTTSVYVTPSPTPAPPTQRPTTSQEWEEDAVTVLLGQVSVEDWNASTFLQQTFKEVMAEEASVYCSSTPALCRIATSTGTRQGRRTVNTVTFSESDVIILPGYPKDFEVHLQIVFAMKLPDTAPLLDGASVPLLPQPALLAISLTTTSELATRTGVLILAVGPYQPPDQLGTSNVGLTVGISVSTVVILLGFIGISAWLLVTIIRTRRTRDMYDSTNYVATESRNVQLLSYKPRSTDTLPYDLERHFTAVNDIDVDVDWPQTSSS